MLQGIQGRRLVPPARLACARPFGVASSFQAQALAFLSRTPALARPRHVTQLFSHQVPDMSHVIVRHPRIDGHRSPHVQLGRHGQLLLFASCESCIEAMCRAQHKVCSFSENSCRAAPATSMSEVRPSALEIPAHAGGARLPVYRPSTSRLLVYLQAPDGRRSEVADTCVGTKLCLTDAARYSRSKAGTTCKTCMRPPLWSCVVVPGTGPGFLVKDTCACPAASCDAALLASGSRYVTCHSQTP